MSFLRSNRTFLIVLIPFLVIPWIKLGNFHLLLFNFSHNRLEFLGFGIEVGTYALIGIVTLLGVAIALISALTLSRFYCGTFCPNTFFAHLLSLFAYKKRSLLSKLIGFSLLSALASMLAFSVVAYGMSTNELTRAIMNLSFAGWLVITLSLLMIAEVYMVQGWYCAYLCPYGTTCAILPIEDRLSYTFFDPDNYCTECEGCVKICPIPNLDIRAGFDLRCIQCGLCEVACEKTFAKMPIVPLIHCKPRSVFQAAGQEKMLLVWVGVILFLALLGGMYLFDKERLNACRLENKILY